MTPRIYTALGFWLCLLYLPLAVQAQQDDSDKIDFVLLNQAARLADLAYHPPSGIRRQAAGDEYRLHDLQVIDEIGLVFFVVSDDARKTHILSIRGTANVENAMLDMSAALVRDAATGLYWHEGFAYAAQQLLQRLQGTLNRDYRILTTGHSLGGALALIVAKMLQDDGYDIAQVITFGQPRVTNYAGARALRSLDVLRVVTPLDMVPLTPPVDPLQLMQGKLDIYWHAGTELLLLEGKHYAILQGMDSMLRATRLDLNTLPQQLLGHHSMDAYLQGLRDKRDNAEQVAFEADFSVFDMLGL